LILSNVINRVFPRLPLPLIQIIFGVGIGLLFKGRAFELETELFLAFIIAPLLFREGEESDITSILRNWKLILFLIFPVIFVSTLGIGYLAKAVLPASVPLSACLAIGAASSLWKKASDHFYNLGNPDKFFADRDASEWVSFTLTTKIISS